MTTTLISRPSGENRATATLWKIGVMVTALFLAIFFALSSAAGGASAADLQCGGIADTGGQGIDCHITVVNNLDLNDPTQTFSTVTVTSCVGAAGAALAGICTTAPAVTYTTLTQQIDQCNYSVNGGGGTLYCTVDVLNQITGTATTPGLATINECNNSLDVASAPGCDTYVDTSTTQPIDTTTNPSTATVLQCNDSVNGGGSTLNCSMDEGSTTSADLPVKVNQCNNSANGGGSTAVCRVRIRTSTRPNSAVTSYTTTTTTATGVPSPLLAPPVVVVPAVVVVPVVVPPVVTPPAGSPPVDTAADSTSGSGSAGTSSARDRLVNTGRLASTGTNPIPAGVLGLMLLLIGTVAALTPRVRTALAGRASIATTEAQPQEAHKKH